jgi:hypothetical protein
VRLRGKDMPFRAAGSAAEPVFKGATLLVADVSRGNVGQLAVDLLVATLQMQCVGYFEDPDVLPAVGASILPSHAARARESARAAGRPCAHDAALLVLPPRCPWLPLPPPAPRPSTDLLKDPCARVRQESRTGNCA